MDDSTFDRLARAVGTESSRRRLLGALSGLGLGGVLAVFETDDAGAEKPKDRLHRRTKQHRRKRRNEQRRNQDQGGGGNGGGGGLGSVQCGTDSCGGSCGTCDPVFQTCCGGTCKNTAYDLDNCGACSHQCQGFTLCMSGTCCIPDPGIPGQCSATVPCCVGTTCRGDGSCCLPAGRTCNGNADVCCSYNCGENNQCS